MPAQRTLILIKPDAVQRGLIGEILARFERNAATPAMAAAANRFAFHVDARDVLSSISAPTLVVHRTGDPVVGVAHGRFMAEHIPGARFSEFPGDFHESGLGKDEEVLDEIEKFLTRQPNFYAGITQPSR